MLTLTCYYNTHIKKNHCLSYLTSYLSGKEVSEVEQTEIETCRGFEENAQNYSIRISLTNGNSVNKIDYVKLVDKTSNRDIRYYHVVSFRYVSQYVYELNLELDTVNTYASFLTSGKFKNVKMKRKMKDRWALYNQTYYRLYDKCDEGLGNVATQVEYNEKVTTENCYIVNRTLEDTDSLHVPFAMNLNRIYVDNGKTVSGTMNVCNYGNSIDIGKITAPGSPIYAFNGWRVFAYCESSDDLLTTNIELEGHDNKTLLCNAYHIRCVKSSEDVLIFAGTYSDGVFTPITSYRLKPTSSSYSGELILNKNYSSGAARIYYEETPNTQDTTLTLGTNYAVSDLITINENNRYMSSDYTKQVSVISVNSLNKYDSQIKAITDVPFFPATNTLIWMGDNVGTIVKKMLTTTASLDLNVSGSEPRHYTKSLNKIVMTRNKVNESKLYGSYVRDHQICYDTFALPVQPEYYNGYVQSISTTLYKPLDLSNDLAFKCTTLKEQSLNSNVMSCTRNNNVVVYSNEYLEYLRNGYNYDEKAQSLNRIKTGVNLAVSLGSVGLNAGLKGAQGKLGTFGLIQSIGTSAATITSSIFSNIENDRALEQKRISLINTSPNMSGATSIDLFKTVNDGNCLRYVTTRPSDEVLESIYNLFYFYGYADNTTKDSLQLTKTREYFDYYQGDAEEFVLDTYYNPLAKKYLVQALSEGITLEYQYNGHWLTEGTLYENWETSI